MIPELGHFSLILAFCCACSLALLPIGLKAIPIDRFNAIAIKLTWLQLCLVLFSLASLFWAFYSNDFSVQYVQANAHHNLPFYYRLTALWGAHEGSMLLWVGIFCIWSYWVSKKRADLPVPVHSILLCILGMLSVGFILFLLLTSNPFIRILPISPIEGGDLNPLLQDPGLIVHPPLLYMGYVGLCVPFASQLCVLFFPQYGQILARWTRTWALSAWAFLTVGIVLGSYWAYYELGWGGYWFWDPVENASFMPWLVTAALVHSLIITDKRGIFQAWTVLLAIYAFALSLIGTFLVRSGVLTSVHAFAVSPERGLYILIFLSVVIATALAIFCARVHIIKNQGYFKAVSKELILLLNNLFLVAIASTILLGTLYPLFIDALFAQKISVGAPYFNAVFIPMILPLILIMGLAPNIHFYQDKLWPHIKAHALLFALLLILCVFLWLYSHSLLFCIGMVIGGWLILATLKVGFEKYQKSMLSRSNTIGMLTAHLGVGIFILGVSLSSHLSIERDVDISVEEMVEIAPYRFRFVELKKVTGPNYEGVRAKFWVEKGGHKIKTLHPEKRYYIPRNMPMTETAIAHSPFRDLYIALSEPTANGAWAVRIYVKPYIIWIWIGGLMIAVGAALSLLALNKSTDRKG